MPIWQHLPRLESRPVTDNAVITVIDLLRHGEVEGGRKYRGQQDDPLSEIGWQQLRQVTNNKQDWQHIITSPLKRCAEFSQELAETHQLPFNIESDFKEISFGLWEGRTAEQLLKNEPESIKQYWNDPINETPPQGENLIDFEKRILTAWKRLLAEFNGQHILLVTHAGVIRIILCYILSIPLTELFKLDVGLAKASRIHIEHADGKNWPRLIFHGSDFI